MFIYDCFWWVKEHAFKFGVTNNFFAISCSIVIIHKSDYSYKENAHIKVIHYLCS